MMANISSCLRRRLAFSISRPAAISSNCETCSAFSSLRCIAVSGGECKGGFVGAPRTGSRVFFEGRRRLGGAQRSLQRAVQECGKLLRQRADLGAAAWPSLKSIRVGMPRMPYLAAVPWLSSTFSYSAATSSRIRAIILQAAPGSPVVHQHRLADFIGLEAGVTDVLDLVAHDGDSLFRGRGREKGTCHAVVLVCNGLKHTTVDNNRVCGFCNRMLRRGGRGPGKTAGQGRRHDCHPTEYGLLGPAHPTGSRAESGLVRKMSVFHRCWG